MRGLTDEERQYLRDIDTDDLEWEIVLDDFDPRREISARLIARGLVVEREVEREDGWRGTFDFLTAEGRLALEVDAAARRVS